MQNGGGLALLWTCENTDDYCRPLFDYWKKLGHVQVRFLDSLFEECRPEAALIIGDYKASRLIQYSLCIMLLSTCCFNSSNI